ncbi:MAG: 4-hydroxy-tetrahydrodipicolinate synthase [Acidimicrobiia bacterium]|nr:4-hydroxy-tetrahydrodipicolinate synthase [Acidimicrobiia bacterium]
MITPFDADGSVDHGKVWDLARFLVESGSEGIVVGGTTGEAPTLSRDEKVALFRAVVEAVGDKAFVVAGTGTYDTRESVEMTREAAAAGCGAAMAVTPYYSRPSQQGLIAHFTAIADAADLPILLYNIPSRTGRLIEVETLATLSRHPGIVAVKDAVGDLGFTTATRVAVGDDLAIYSGDDLLTLPMMAVGGVGVVSVATHLAGPQVAGMVAAALAGDWERARNLHLALAPLCKALFVEPNPQPVKGGLNAFWGSDGEPRLPLVPAAAATVEAIGVALEVARRA